VLTADGYETKNEELPSRKCTEEDFSNFYPLNTKREAYKELLSWYCIEQVDFQIYGNWEAKTGSLLLASLTSCNQAKLQPGQKCKSEDEALAILTKKDGGGNGALTIMYNN